MVNLVFNSTLSKLSTTLHHNVVSFERSCKRVVGNHVLHTLDCMIDGELSRMVHLIVDGGIEVGSGPVSLQYETSLAQLQALVSCRSDDQTAYLKHMHAHLLEYHLSKAAYGDLETASPAEPQSQFYHTRSSPKRSVLAGPGAHRHDPPLPITNNNNNNQL